MFAQQSPRSIDDALPKENQPIKVVDRRWKTTSLKDNRQIAAEKDWLKDVTFDVQNIADKPIVGFSMYLIVPREGRMPQSIRIPVIFRAPGTKLKRDALVPGQMITVGVLDGYRKKTADILAKWEADDFKRVTLSVEVVYFEDATAWMEGRMMRQNPNNSDEWLPMTWPEHKSHPVPKLPDMINIPSPIEAIFETLDLGQRFLFRRGPSREPELGPTVRWNLAMVRR